MLGVVAQSAERMIPTHDWITFPVFSSEHLPSVHWIYKFAARW